MELVACQLRACEHVMLTAARTPASPQRTAHHAATARVPLPRPALHARFFATAPVSHASFCATWGFVAHVRNSFRYFASCGWKRPLVGEIRMFSEPKSPTKALFKPDCRQIHRQGHFSSHNFNFSEIFLDVSRFDQPLNSLSRIGC